MSMCSAKAMPTRVGSLFYTRNQDKAARVLTMHHGQNETSQAKRPNSQQPTGFPKWTNAALEASQADSLEGTVPPSAPPHSGELMDICPSSSSSSQVFPRQGASRINKDDFSRLVNNVMRDEACVSQPFKRPKRRRSHLGSPISKRKPYRTRFRAAPFRQLCSHLNDMFSLIASQPMDIDFSLQMWHPLMPQTAPMDIVVNMDSNWDATLQDFIGNTPDFMDITWPGTHHAKVPPARNDIVCVSTPQEFWESSWPKPTDMEICQDPVSVLDAMDFEMTPEPVKIQLVPNEPVKMPAKNAGRFIARTSGLVAQQGAKEADPARTKRPATADAQSTKATAPKQVRNQMIPGGNDDIHDSVPIPTDPTQKSALVALYFTGVDCIGPRFIRAPRLRRQLRKEHVKGVSFLGLNDVELLAEQHLVEQVKAHVQDLGLRLLPQRDPLTAVNSQGLPIDDRAFIADFVRDTVARWNEAGSRCRDRTAREWYATHAELLREKYVE